MDPHACSKPPFETLLMRSARSSIILTADGVGEDGAWRLLGKRDPPSQNK